MSRKIYSQILIMIILRYWVINYLLLKIFFYIFWIFCKWMLYFNSKSNNASVWKFSLEALYGHSTSGIFASPSSTVIEKLTPFRFWHNEPPYFWSRGLHLLKLKDYLLLSKQFKAHPTWWVLIFPTLLTLINLMGLTELIWMSPEQSPPSFQKRSIPHHLLVRFLEHMDQLRAPAFQTLQEYAISNCLFFITFIKAWMRKVKFMKDYLKFIFAFRYYKFCARIKPNQQRFLFLEYIF